MFAVLWQRLDILVKWGSPLITAFLFILIGIVPWPLPYWGAVAPAFVLIAVYYWAVHRPDLFHPSGAFVVGLVYDAVNDLPIGLSAFIFVGLHQLALSQRRFFVGHSFFMLWTGFALTMTTALVANLILLFFLQGHLQPLTQPLVQAVLTILLFPLPAWMLIRLQRSLLSVE